ncbi:SDR family NAD(P)-dependent oxidoreductase [Nonomuraea zeae]|uniref:SDR family NAD(P)-dependent oxidoreductase n=1 Tax=Nonomuraea zeae TaxID=1642303 RepID=A0A5S4GZ83_9ACTN|nr:SDR family NAD(P)-dependent oxidoreductase [Nonomuraea zeae]TMR38283.1 SDR family NAD(P)-dependent oxidoreductase [Nonomuraea zeae]
MAERTQQLIVVTGASTGMGASAARELARQGLHVLAGVRRERDADAIRSTGIEPVILDITEPEQVEALAARVAGDPRAYAGAKFALEAVSDSLRREVAPLGVQVIVVEPGGVRTEMAARGIATANQLAAQMTPEQDQRYGGLVQAINTLMASGTASGVSADAAARVIAKAVTTRKPRTRYTIGRDAALITRLTRMLSDRALDRVIAANLRRHYPKGAAA